MNETTAHDEHNVPLIVSYNKKLALAIRPIDTNDVILFIQLERYSVGGRVFFLLSIINKSSMLFWSIVPYMREQQYNLLTFYILPICP